MSCYISQSLPLLLIHYLDTTLSYSFCHLFYAKLFFAQQTWDPISPQQRHGASIVEVYRIIEEVLLFVPHSIISLNKFCLILSYGIVCFCFHVEIFLCHNISKIFACLRACLVCYHLQPYQILVRQQNKHIPTIATITKFHNSGSLPLLNLYLYLVRFQTKCIHQCYQNLALPKCAKIWHYQIFLVFVWVATQRCP